MAVGSSNQCFFALAQVVSGWLDAVEKIAEKLMANAQNYGNCKKNDQILQREWTLENFFAFKREKLQEYFRKQRNAEKCQKLKKLQKIATKNAATIHHWSGSYQRLLVNRKPLLLYEPCEHENQSGKTKRKRSQLGGDIGTKKWTRNSRRLPHTNAHTSAMMVCSLMAFWPWSSNSWTSRWCRWSSNCSASSWRCCIPWT